MLHRSIILIFSIIVFSSCSTRKEILYLQDIDSQNNSQINYTESEIQPNDVLSINIVALNVETSEPYNLQNNNNQAGGGQMLQLQGYLVTPDYTINLPVLGEISVKGKTTRELSNIIKNVLEDGGHLINPTVNVRLLNAKITILGEVNLPGTIEFTEQNLTLLQALGYAGGLTINGVREDIIIIRDDVGVKKISHIDITTSDWMNGPFYFVKPNDTIIVNPNGPEVKRAGYIPDLAGLISLVTLSLTLTILLTN